MNQEADIDNTHASAPEVLPEQRISFLEAELDRMALEKGEIEDLLKRRQADHENFRKRTERERAEIFEYATMEAVRSMLPVIDDFERALQTAPSDDSPADYAKGVRLIHQRMLDAMSKLGLECLASVGAPFDPNLHHAIQKEEREEMDDQTILEEFQRGYTFKGKLLRPAMVKVSVKP